MWVGQSLRVSPGQKETQIRYLPASSVALWEDSEKGQWPLLTFCLEESCAPVPASIPDTSVPP